MSISYDKAVPFVGVGTGRCGSNSLARIVGACQFCNVTHESSRVPWYEAGPRLGKLLIDMNECANRGVTRGEVAMYLIPHIGAMRSAISNLKVVCLHRSKVETVDSFMRFGSHMIRPADKRGWSENSRGARAEAIRYFPVIDAASPRQAYEFWWEMATELMAHIPEPVLHFHMQDFNDDDKVTELFDFLDIPEQDRVMMERRAFWTGEEVETAKKEMSRARAV